MPFTPLPTCICISVWTWASFFYSPTKTPTPKKKTLTSCCMVCVWLPSLYFAFSAADRCSVPFFVLCFNNKEEGHDWTTSVRSPLFWSVAQTWYTCKVKTSRYCLNVTPPAVLCIHTHAVHSYVYRVHAFIPVALSDVRVWHNSNTCAKSVPDDN